MSKRARPHRQYMRQGPVLPIPQVLNWIISDQSRVEVNDTTVGVTSLRLQVFAKKGTVCTGCGLKAQYFAVESCHGQTSHHLNLWGVNDKKEEVLFTHDHTIARSLGGKDELDNCTTMCSPCNRAKSVIENQQVMKLRGIDPNSPEMIAKRTARKRASRARVNGDIERMAVDIEYRNTVMFHQRRLGRNDFEHVDKSNWISH